ncbi:regulatory P domain-containing protein [Hirsutella rhossiliensis]|uniref:Regulatory P domain-containing protein n=1 Tax=Hirsutella rhossiliensis TaxID=111463 RepID=A0A9P8SER1_9HYPO|nr:regulatory P domain-containing protein [Hirsutella rhossiliensis]KAH0958296.1 regulatory P domain-containing protein [Hirsutella rhossiliensis]
MMKGSITSFVLATLAGTALAGPTRVSKSEAVVGPADLQAYNAPNAVSMEESKRMKLDQQARDEQAGAFAKDRYILQPATACKDGKAGEYSCNKLDLKGFLRHQDMQSRSRRGNDVWGWTSPDGREFALVGQADGTAFVEVLSDGSLQYFGRLNTQTEASIWRDIKVIGNHAYIGSEAPDHGLQIFDLTKLLKVDPKNPPSFSTSSDLAALFSGFGSSHNIVANEETKTIFAVGTARNEKCRGGLWMVDVSNPRHPQDNGCVSQDGYVHDAQCVIYRGPQRDFQGREICHCFNEDSLTIVDITNRPSPRQLSRTTYKGASYTHQGWLATSDQRYLLLDDEQDELKSAGMASDGHTTTYIVDVSDLTKPVFTGIYKSPVKSIDHNQYVLDGLSYQSNYGSGLRMVNVSTIVEDDTGSLFKEVGFFDVYPNDDAEGGTVTFNGAWSVYPYFKSGYVLVNSIERGIFSLKFTG